MQTLPDQAMLFMIAALPVSIWVAWSDMKFMRIPNLAVIALALGFVLLGPFVLPLDAYLWRLTHLVVILAIGFVMNAVRMIGAGDAKFAAAMAPFIARGDAVLFIYVFAAVLLAAYAVHRTARAIAPVRRATPDWQSWVEKKDFPMGLALGGALIAYLALALTQTAP